MRAIAMLMLPPVRVRDMKPGQPIPLRRVGTGPAL